MKRGFGSDNFAGAHPEVLAAIATANEGHVKAYGGDPLTAQATQTIRKHLGADVMPYFVFNGTAANVLGLQALTRPHHAILCASGAHIDADECGAPERFTGCKLVPIDTPDGKLTPALVEKHVWGVGDQHHVQPKVISITQATEVGTVYQPHEIRELANFAHARGMFLHMDGARLANAAAGLGCDLRSITFAVGVDALSLGGTKNGMLFGEAVVLRDAALAADFLYLRKQGMQLSSKMRFVAAQFEAMYAGDLWQRNARHANAMARRLSEKAAAIPGVRLAQPTQASGVFAILPRASIAVAQSRSFFYVWNEERCEVRWMCSWDTTESDVDELITSIAMAVP